MMVSYGDRGEFTRSYRASTIRWFLRLIKESVLVGMIQMVKREVPKFLVGAQD